MKDKPLTIMEFGAIAEIARRILSESKWDVVTDDHFTKAGGEIEFTIDAVNETFFYQDHKANDSEPREMSHKETIDWLEAWNG